MVKLFFFLADEQKKSLKNENLPSKTEKLINMSRLMHASLIF